MATGQLNHVVNHLRRAALRCDHDALGDGVLLARFVAQRDEAAFETLVRRHGGMVLAVCRRVVGSFEDAQDACQATFFVLARKAASVRAGDQVGNWLYGVAYRTALAARSNALRRLLREKQVSELPHPLVESDPGNAELLRLLDHEVCRLPDKYRTPIVLCELEGCSRKDAAERLQVPEGTLSSRLATGRKLLAARLTARGAALSIGALTALLTEQAAHAAMPAALAADTARSALIYATGGAGAAKVLSLTEGVLKTMFLSKLGSIASWVGVLCLVAGGITFAWRHAHGSESASADAFATQPVQAKSTPPAGDKRDQPAKKAAPIHADQAFTQIHLKMGKAVIKQTGRNHVAVKADDLFAKNTKSSVENGTLTLQAPNPAIAFDIEVKELAGLKLEGVSEVRVTDLNSKRLTVSLAGVATLTIAGSADAQIIEVSGGAARFNGEACKGKEVSVTVNGPGQAVVFPIDKLTVKIPAAGRVEYVGTPKVIEQDVGFAGTLRPRGAPAEPGQPDPARKDPPKEPVKELPVKPGSVKITAKVDGYTQGTEFNTAKYPFKYTGASVLDPDQVKALAKAGDLPDAAARALLSAALWPGKDDKLDKVKLKSDGAKITGDVELSHKYGKQGVHVLKFKIEATLSDGKLALRAVDPVVLGTWDWGGGKIKLVGKVDIQFETAK